MDEEFFANILIIILVVRVCAATESGPGNNNK